jgi:hypothetical protein
VQLFWSSHGTVSFVPSQLLSRPSQISSAGISAEQADNPEVSQVRCPVHAPYSFSTTHEVLLPIIASVQEHSFESDLHCPPWQPKPGGHGAFSEQAVPQNDPAFP